MTLIPDTGGACSTWADLERFAYRGNILELRYQAEPPHGDFLYSLTLPADRSECRLPLWIFGRSLFFFGPSFLLAESVPAGSCSGLNSVIVDLALARYFCLDGWYRSPRFTGWELLLARFRDGAPLRLDLSVPLAWRKFDCGGGPL